VPRPYCRRIVEIALRTDVFKPAGTPLGELAIVEMTLDELEALRLVDLDGLYQEDAAARMRVSRPTLGRIVESGRRKVADALVHRKALRIEGGPVLARPQRGHCPRCAERRTPGGAPAGCPRCRYGPGITKQHESDDEP